LIFNKVTDENKLAPFLWPTVYIKIHSESEFGFTGKSNGLDSWVQLSTCRKWRHCYSFTYV